MAGQAQRSGGASGPPRRSLRLPSRLRRETLAAGSAGVRPRLMLATAVAVVPILVFASWLALRNAGLSLSPSLTVAWAAAAAAPFALFVAAVAAIGWAVEANVLRWLDYLERLTDLYSRGRYDLRPAGMEQAPTEFRALSAAVSDMAEAIEARDRELRTALEEQTMLLREVHHRVKNNLQIIGSQLGLQASRADDDTVRDALVEALVRVDALSLVQRYTVQDETGCIDVAAMLHALADQVRGRLRYDRRLELDVDAVSVELPVAAATALLLVAAEGLLAVHARPGEAAPETVPVRLLFSRDHPDLRLCIEGPEGADLLDDDAYLRTLIGRYARQLKGELSVEAPARRLELRMPAPALPLAA